MTRTEHAFWCGLVYIAAGVILSTIAFAVYCITQ